MAGDRDLVVRPIGWVVHGRPWPPGDERWEELQVEIEIDSAWAEALDGLDGFSHVWVVWWLDRAPARYTPGSLHIHPQGREEIPKVGLFATRSPRRLNPIAITAVRLLERQGNRLHVLGLDAYVGSPILDLKPYLRRGDLIPDATAPAWLDHLWQIHDEERGKGPAAPLLAKIPSDR
ncbi:MAG: tRNA (N6-threonylcarbamoyladenosine(37)-N6)-methyltransferase TrmO [Anaerolineae bacterium]|nr:tRNA (N6-threonylcarbamoyladenosine(37)-N6)-methyltransferase TrmO [Anaerolineae bacterium]